MSIIVWIVLSFIAAAIARTLFPKKHKLAFATGYLGVLAAGWLTISIFSWMHVTTNILTMIVGALAVPGIISGFLFGAFVILFGPIILLSRSYPREEPIGRWEYERLQRNIENERIRGWDKYQEFQAKNQELQAKCEELQAKCEELQAFHTEAKELRDKPVSRRDKPVTKNKPMNRTKREKLNSSLSKAYELETRHPITDAKLPEDKTPDNKR